MFVVVSLANTLSPVAGSNSTVIKKAFNYGDYKKPSPRMTAGKIALIKL